MSLVVIPGGTSEFVELAGTTTSKMFRKMILPMDGSFVHPKDKNTKIKIDSKFAETLVANFKAGRSIVQFPMVNEKNQHVEDPERNMGEVVDLTYDDTGVYATIDVRKNPESIGTTLLGASAMMHLDYEDTATGEHVGPTLLHVAGTNRPYLTNLKGYEEVALSVDDTDNEVVVFTPQERSTTEDSEMDLDTLLSTLKEEHDIDVLALQAQAAAPKTTSSDELVSALSAVISTAAPNLLTLSADDLTVTDVAQAVVELSRENLGMKESLEALQNEKAAVEVDAHVSEGRILPAQRDAMLELRMSNSDMYERLLPETAIVSLSEEGVTVHERPGNPTYENAQQEIDRLAEVLKDNG